MPIYSFICDPGCGLSFEVVMSMSQYDKSKNKVVCPKCNSQTCRRDLQSDLPQTSVKLGDNELKLGHLAQRNTERLSNDEKNHLNYEHNKYKFTQPKRDPPKGMHRIGIPSAEKLMNKQRKRDPKRKIRGKSENK